MISWGRTPWLLPVLLFLCVPALSTMQSTAISKNAATARATSKETIAVTNPSSGIWPKITEPWILILAAMSVFLLVVASLLAWRMAKQKKKAAGTTSEQKRVLRRRQRDQLALSSPSSFLSPGNLEVIQQLQEELCYADLPLHHTGSSTVFKSRKKASTKSTSSLQANKAEAPFRREEIHYAFLSLETSNQEPTYSNTSQLMAHILPGSHEEPTEYSSIRKL